MSPLVFPTGSIDARPRGGDPELRQETAVRAETRLRVGTRRTRTSLLWVTVVDVEGAAANDRRVIEVPNDRVGDLVRDPEAHGSFGGEPE